MSGAKIFAGTDKAIFVSDDDGLTWSAPGPQPKNALGDPAVILSLAVSGSNILAGSLDSLLVSTDDGANWTEPKTEKSGYSIPGRSLSKATACSLRRAT